MIRSSQILYNLCLTVEWWVNISKSLKLIKLLLNYLLLHMYKLASHQNGVNVEQITVW